MEIIGYIVRFFAERSAKNKSYDDLLDKLEQSESDVSHRLQAMQDTPHNREIAAHIIGIERWGQRRLRSLLGEPLLEDEHDGYRPSTEQSLPALQKAFDETRSQTIDVTRSLQETHTPLTAKVQHNQAGPMSVGAWLVYLSFHAARESRALK